MYCTVAAADGVSVGARAIADAGLNFLFCHEMNCLHEALHLIFEQLIYVFVYSVTACNIIYTSQQSDFISL